MNLILTQRLIPIRNETGEIYKWEEKTVCLVPTNIQAADYEENVDKVVVRMTNGDKIIVGDTIKEFDRKYAAASDIKVVTTQANDRWLSGFYVGVLAGAASTCIGYLLSLVFAK
jgi:hypothetical protein